VRRSEIEQRALDRKREEEKRELQKKSIRKRVAGGVGDGYDVLANSSDASSLPGAASKAKASSLKVRENVSDEEKIDEMVLPKAEVIRRLSYLKHPITLFGEGDDARQSRLKALLKAGVTDPDSELMEGQRNDFLVDMAELRKREKHGGLEPRKEKKRKMQRLRRTETRMAVGVENRLSMVMGASHPVSTTTRT
jgi:pre-mRNA-splicing factor 18